MPCVAKAQLRPWAPRDNACVPTTAWGGYYTELPAALRIASLLSATLYGGVMLIALAKAGLVRVPFGPGFIRASLRIMTALFFLGTLMNLASQSYWERVIMTPLALILAICFFILARHPRSQ
jgi:hypothetical protein